MIVGVLVLISSGCEPESTKQRRLAEIEAKNESRVTEAKRVVTEIEKKIAELEQLLAERESKWQSAVNERHPDWSTVRSKEQIDILVHKWNSAYRVNGDGSINEDESICSMKRFASRLYPEFYDIPIELVEEDYRDIIRAKSADKSVVDRINALRDQLYEVNASITPDNK